MNLWIVPCRYEQGSLIIECINRIKHHHPKDDIAVVDSFNYNKSYMDSLDVKIKIEGNSNYVWGALLKTREVIDFKKYDRICLIHDSVFLKDNIDFFLQSREVSCLKWFDSWKAVGGTAAGYGFGTGEDLQWTIDECSKIGLEWPEFHFTGLFGSIFFANPKVIQDLISLGLDKVKPTNKAQCTAMERILGYALTTKLGYDLKSNSMLGDFFNYQFSNDYIEKHFLRRQ